MADIDVLLQENRKFPPPAEFSRRAHVSSHAIFDSAAADYERYWADRAAELEWFEPWKNVLEWKPPHAKWFTGGKLNVAVNCVDRHVRTATRNKAALIWEGEPGDRRTLT
jgi:acetyl-CoA synthetase